MRLICSFWLVFPKNSWISCLMYLRILELFAISQAKMEGDQLFTIFSNIDEAQRSHIQNCKGKWLNVHRDQGEFWAHGTKIIASYQIQRSYVWYMKSQIWKQLNSRREFQGNISICSGFVLLLGICLRPQLESGFGGRWTFCQTQYRHSEVTGTFVNTN